MEIIRPIVKKSIVVIVPLALLTFVIDWNIGHMRFAGLFGKSNIIPLRILIPLSIIIGAIIGLANAKGLVWGIESLLGTYKASAKLLFLSIFRLFILFTIIIILAVFRLINLLGLALGMTVVFIILIIEAVKVAKMQEKE